MELIGPDFVILSATKLALFWICNLVGKLQVSELMFLPCVFITVIIVV